MAIPDLDIIVSHSDDSIREELCKAVATRHNVTARCATVSHLKQAALDQRPDLVITGIHFPDGEGIDTVIAIGDQRPMPCVVSTKMRSLDLVRKAMEDHVMAFLIEPVREEDLAAAILVAWSRFQQLRALQEEVDDLRTALKQRKVIERAKGILMASNAISEDEAFSTLRKRAQNARGRLIDIASQVVEEFEASSESDGSGSRD